MRTTRILAGVLCGVALCAAAPLQAQTASDDTTRLANEIIECAGLESGTARLACYDGVAGPLMGITESEDGIEDGSLHSFTGKNDWDSDVLEIEGPWRLVWQNQGSLLTVELRSAQGELIDVVGNQIGKGGGRSKALAPGSYRLAVRGLGGWRVHAVDDRD